MPGGNVGPGVVVDLTRGLRDAPAVIPDARTASAQRGETAISRLAEHVAQTINAHLASS